MQLNPPIEQYVTGNKPSHCSRTRLKKHLPWSETEINRILAKGQYITSEGKITRKSQIDGLIDSCDGKSLWNIKSVRIAFLDLTKNDTSKPVAKPVAAKKPREARYGDLDIVGAYFGVSKVKVGQWLTEMGFRAEPKLEKNESGSIDMLDVARASQEKFGGKAKIPTEAALSSGLAQENFIVAGEKEFTIYKWNIDMCRALLLKAGHAEDT
jgi:hypothetical protein